MNYKIEELKLKNKKRKTPWIWYCENCRGKLELDSGDIYFEARCYHEKKDIYLQIYDFSRVCSRKCAEQRINLIKNSKKQNEKFKRQMELFVGPSLDELN